MLEGMGGGALAAVPDDDAHIEHSSRNADDIGIGPGDVEADLGVGDVGGADEAVEAAGDHGHPRILALAVLEHPDRDGQEGKQGQGLVGPGKVAPQDLEALVVELGEHQDHGHQGEDDGGQAQALALGALVDVQGLRHRQAQAAQGGIAGGDGQDHNAHQGDDAAHGTQDVLTNLDNSAGGAGIGGLETSIEDAHGGAGPNHGDEAFQNHHVVEGHAALLLAFHGAGEPDSVINVGVSGPGVVRSALSKIPDGNITDVADVVKKTAFKITRVGQLVASRAAEKLGVPFGIVDLSLAPTPAVGDSVAHILEEMGLEQCGACGTTACLALLNDAVKKGGVMASSHVGGLSGAFIPVSEDAGMIDAARSGTLKIEKLEAMTAVCSVGLDMIAVPGDTPAEVISAIIADEAAIGMVNSKTTAVRVIPAIGRSDDDEVEFGGLFGSSPIMKVNTSSPAKFINRGGRIPAPLQSLKN